MGKSFSKVRPQTFQKWDSEHYVVHFNIVETPDVVDGKQDGVKYEYEHIIVDSLDRKTIIEALVKRKYSIDDEIALAFGRVSNEADLKAHEDYVVECKAIADGLMLKMR